MREKNNSMMKIKKARNKKKKKKTIRRSDDQKNKNKKRHRAMHAFIAHYVNQSRCVLLTDLNGASNARLTLWNESRS